MVAAAGASEFEAGLCKNEQAREPALSSHTLGMKELMIGASKMDS